MCSSGKRKESREGGESEVVGTKRRGGGSGEGSKKGSDMELRFGGN